MKSTFFNKPIAVYIVTACLFGLVLSLILKQDVLSHIYTSKYILSNESSIKDFIEKSENASNIYKIPLSLNNNSSLSVTINTNTESNASSSLNINLYNETLNRIEQQEEFGDVQNNETIIANFECKTCNEDKVSLKIVPNDFTLQVNKISILQKDRINKNLSVAIYVSLAFLYTMLLFMLGIFVVNYRKELFSLKSLRNFTFITTIVFLLFSYLYNTFNWDMVNIPMSFDGYDDGHFLSVAKNAVDGNSFWYMDNMGAPFGVDRTGFPMLMAFYYGFCRFLGLFTDNVVFINNLYYICTFVFATFSFMLVTKLLKLNYSLGVLASVIYAFSQYHFCRQLTHVTASSYFVAPIVLYWCLKIVISKDFNDKCNALNDKFKLYSGIILSAFLIGSVDIFYAYFGCAFLSICIIIALLDKRYVAFMRGITLISIIIITLISNLYPPIVSGIVDSASSKITHRNPYEAFHYGLMLVQLFMPKAPGDSHIFSTLYENYHTFHFLKGEATTSYLGIFGCIGFLISICILIFAPIKKFFQKYETEQNKGFFSIVTSLNIFGFLFGSSAGIGPIIALMGFTKVRTYNRISVYILLFSLLTLFYLIDLLFKKYFKSKKALNVTILCCFLVMPYIHIEETNLAKFIPDYEKIKTASLSTKQFAENIDNLYDDGSSILQLPIVSYPESRVSESITNWTRPVFTYMFTKNINWSYGALPMTEMLMWQRQLFDIKDIKQLVLNAVNSGFSGISVYADLYFDNPNIIEEFKSVLGEPLFIETNYNIYFFDLTNLKMKDDILKNSENLLISDDFIENGWGVLEQSDDYKWRWATINKDDQSQNKRKDKVVFSTLKYTVLNNRPYKIKFNFQSPVRNKVRVYLDEHLIKEFNVKPGENYVETNWIHEKSSNNIVFVKELKLRHSSSFVPARLMKGSVDKRRLAVNYRDIHIEYK